MALCFAEVIGCVMIVAVGGTRGMMLLVIVIMRTLLAEVQVSAKVPVVNAELVSGAYEPTQDKGYGQGKRYEISEHAPPTCGGVPFSSGNVYVKANCFSLSLEFSC